MLVKLIILLVGVTAATCRHTNFYRKDYVYNDEYDAFYKFHLDENRPSWGSAFLACDDEGAELFYPHTREEWTVVKELAYAANISPNVTDIFVGIHDKFGLGEFLTVNGQPMSTPILNTPTIGKDRCVTMKIDTGVLEANECISEPDDVRPFVCKKVEDVTCPTIDKGYKYMKETKKCYKKNDRAKTWSQAMETCYMEGGILVVVTSEVEAEVIRVKIINSDVHYDYYAGFKRMFPHNEFYTVTGHKLRDSGFDRWYDDGENECGVIRNYNSQLYQNSVNCDQKFPFVCQMDITV